MKRYRVLILDFDSGPSVLRQTIQEKWDEQKKAEWRRIQETVKQNLLHEYGHRAAEMKLQNYTDLGPKPMSILAFHNKFFEQIRRAFIIGSYYPSLTAACALGERILNHLMRTLRDDFRHTSEYKKVHRKDSFDNWEVPIKTLESWRVLLDEVVSAFRDLKELRQRSIHFDPSVDSNDRALALEAIGKLSNIIDRQFGAFANQPWFIPGIPGASYLKKEAENEPFIKRIYIPKCALVGPHHKLSFDEGWFQVHDDYPYEDREISDEQFRILLDEKPPNERSSELISEAEGQAESS